MATVTPSARIRRSASRERTLSEMIVEGVQTNIALHRELMQDGHFVEGGTSIHYLEHKLAARA